MKVEYIDLGLPSGTLWATDNADVNYYCFDEAASKFVNQLPTRTQFCELIDYCDFHFDEDTKEGVFTRDGKELRFPASGSVYSRNGTLFMVGIKGYYWSCSPYHDSYGYCLNFDSGIVNVTSYSSTFAFHVRLVKNNFK